MTLTMASTSGTWVDVVGTVIGSAAVKGYEYLPVVEHQERGFPID